VALTNEISIFENDGALLETTQQGDRLAWCWAVAFFSHQQSEESDESK
jgi:hypothetical protein